MEKLKMNKKGKNSKKVGTDSGNITNNNLEAIIVTEEIKDNKVILNSDKEHEALDDMKNASTSNVAKDNDDDENDDESATDEEWDLKKIMSIDAIKQACPIKCSHETCFLVAATAWTSNQKPNENWYSCLDCQENDFDGWPDLEELPLKHMTQEHKNTLIEHCSKYKDCPMPNFDCSPTKSCDDLVKPSSNTITPPPVSGILGQQGKSIEIHGTVTPYSNDSVIDSKKKSAELKPSKAQLEIHRKWQAAAETAGGESARIVLHKAVAKKIIFDFLLDAFRPMNITEIHKGLKAIVPSPILKACLDDMALDNDVTTQFVNSDSEDEEQMKKKVDMVTCDHSDTFHFKKALLFKGAKGSNSGLYYVNHNTAKGGDGLDRDEKNQLASDIANADANYSALQSSLDLVRLKTNKLHTEPLNNMMNGLLLKAETESLELSAQLDLARTFKCNEKHKEGTVKRINYFSSYWRKRRKMCMDFLITMEELTEGTVSVKCCLSGNGPIDIDSDENIIKLALDFAGKKEKRILLSKRGTPACKLDAKTSGLQVSENFVAVALDAQGNVKRIYLHDETMSV